MKKKLFGLLICIFLFISISSVCAQDPALNLPSTTQVDNYYGYWKDGKDDTHPGYVRDFKLPVNVKIESNDSDEEDASSSNAGAIVYMMANGGKEDFPKGADLSVSTDEAMGYGMILAVLDDDIELFNKYLRVANYYDSIHHDKLTSWVIPAEQGYDWTTSTEYKELEAKEKIVTDNNWQWNKGDWNEDGTNDSPTEHWLIRYNPKLDGDRIVGQLLNKNLNNETETVSGIAMDGELDIAYALLMAHDKWVLNGNKEYKYINMACERFFEIIQIIAGDRKVNNKYYGFGVHENPDASSDSYYLPTGAYKYDHGNDITRPCDWLLSHLRGYYECVGDKITKDIVGALKAQMMDFTSTDNIGTDTGLVPDFAEFEPKTSGTEKLVPTYTEYTNDDGDLVFAAGEDLPFCFYINAARYPFRQAIDYILYNDEYSLEKAVDILDFLSSQAAPFQVTRNIDGTIAEPVYDNQTLKAALIIAAYAADMSGNTSYNSFFNSNINNLKNTFSSLYATWEEEWDVLDENGDPVHVDKNGNPVPPDPPNTIPLIYEFDMHKDPGHTGYFEDTWTILALETLTGRWTRPHAFKNELEEADLSDWKIIDGSNYASLSTNSSTGDLTVTINSIPSSNDAFAISIGTDDFTSMPHSGYSFFMTVKKENGSNTTSIEAEQSYPDNGETETQSLQYQNLVINNEVPIQSFMGVFAQALKDDKTEQKSQIRIGLNEGLTVGTKFTFNYNNFGLFDPPGEAKRFRYVGVWISNRKYEAGDYVRYQHETYRCIQDNDASSSLNPKDSPAYWEASDYTQIGSVWQPYTFYYDGDLVYYNGRTYVCGTSFFSVTPPSDGTAVWLLYYNPYEGIATDWYAGSYYEKGEYILYNGNAYKCTVAHASFAGWNPESAFVLWEKCNHVFRNIDPQPWETWTAYQVGAVVEYDSIKYECTTGHTALPGWEPATTLNVLWTIY